MATEVQLASFRQGEQLARIRLSEQVVQFRARSAATPTEADPVIVFDDQVVVGDEGDRVVVGGEE